MTRKVAKVKKLITLKNNTKINLIESTTPDSKMHGIMDWEKI